MSQYNGRRAPNVSQYIANLNTIPSAADVAGQQDFANFVDDDLAMFTNTQFFDFDMNEPVPEMPNDVAFMHEQQRQGHNVPQDANKGMGFVNQPNFGFNEFNIARPQPQPMTRIVSPHHSLPPSPPNGIQGNYAAQQSQPTVPTIAAFAAHTPVVGEKRKSAASSLPSAAQLEEDSRMAAEEDKRRRNTAASARFRVKKKQREQALEKSAKEMSDKVQLLEARVGQLEMENKWLKGLITEKNLKMDGAPIAAPLATKLASKDKTESQDDAESEDEQKEEAELSTEERKDGVGTEAEAVEA